MAVYGQVGPVQFPAALDGEEINSLPDPSPLERVLRLEEAEGGAVAFADVSFDFLEGKSVPVNVTMPLYVRNRIDKAAKAHGMPRSAFLVESVLERARAQA